MDPLRPLREILSSDAALGPLQAAPDADATWEVRAGHSVRKIRSRVPASLAATWDAYRIEISEELTDLRWRVVPSGVPRIESWHLAEWRAYFRYPEATELAESQLESTLDHYRRLCMDALDAMARMLRVLSQPNLQFKPSPVYRNPMERLYRDILRLAGLDAVLATLEEDIFERTDLRVRMQELGRRHGARVQVKDTAEPARVLAAEENYINPEEFVFLTPYSVASYFQVDREKRITMAREIQFRLNRALDRARRTGVSPATLVASDTVKQIATFTVADAIRSTHALRKRESKVGTVMNASQLRRRLKAPR